MLAYTNSYLGKSAYIQLVTGAIVTTVGTYLHEITATTPIGITMPIVSKFRVDFTNLDSQYDVYYCDHTNSYINADYGITDPITGVFSNLPFGFDNLHNCMVNPSGELIPFYVHNNRWLIVTNLRGLYIYNLQSASNLYLMEYFPVKVYSQSRVFQLLSQIRYTLADTNKQRWTDERLVALINEAQSDIAKRSDWFKSSYSYTFTGNSIPMDIDMISIFKAEDVNGANIKFMQQDDLDRTNPDWKLETGTVIEAIVIDRLLTNAIVVYPSMTIPTVLTITASIIPKPVDLLNSDLKTSTMLDTAIMFYVTGRALRDDSDVQNRQIGNEQIGMYEMELKKLMTNKANNFKRYSNRVVNFTNPFMRWGN